MKDHYAKLVKVAIIYGGACFFLHWGLSDLGWRLFPDNPKDDELAHQVRWFHHIMAEKFIGLALLCVAVFFASRAHHPTRNWGVATAIAAAAVFELTGALVYIGRFGIAEYQRYNNFLYTILWTLLLANLFGYLAVRNQHLQ